MAVTVGSAPAIPVSSEEKLIVAARDGDDRALEELYARYRDRILAYIRRRISDPGRAEDVSQEVFISAVRRLRATDQPIIFKPWIYEIAKNACIDEHRRVLRNREVSLDAETELGGAPPPLLSLAPTPPAALESKQRMQDLRGAFRDLSENHHRLLVMREFEGLSYDEIGARMGMTREMVESALFRARRKLGAEYEELSSGRRCQQVQAAIDTGRVHAYRSMGIRERRRLARHLAHCQPCRMSAQLAGVDEDFVRPRGLGARIAALLPFPVWGWWRGVASRAAARAGGPTAQAAGAASQSAASAAFTGAAVAVATLAIAAGSGTPGALAQHGRPRASQVSVSRTHAPSPDIGAWPRHSGATAPALQPTTPAKGATRSSALASRRPHVGSAGPSAAAGTPSTPASPAGSDSAPVATGHVTSTLPAAPAVPAVPASQAHVISNTLNSVTTSSPVKRVLDLAKSAVPVPVSAVPSAPSVPSVPAAVTRPHGLGLGALNRAVPSHATAAG